MYIVLAIILQYACCRHLEWRCGEFQGVRLERLILKLQQGELLGLRALQHYTRRTRTAARCRWLCTLPCNSCGGSSQPLQ